MFLLIGLEISGIGLGVLATVTNPALFLGTVTCMSTALALVTFRFSD